MPEPITEATEQLWQEAMQAAGDVIRPGAKDNPNWPERLHARTYTLNTARKRLNASRYSMDQAVATGLLPIFADPTGETRISAAVVESLLADDSRYELIVANESVEPREMAEVLDMSYSAIRRRLDQAGVRGQPRWNQVRGQWGLPETLQAFYKVLHERRTQEKEDKKKRVQERRVRERDQRETERQRREDLRQRLMDSFPTWQDEHRVNQNLVLHVGPPNSGKTHEALNRLAEAGSGWYLAPLRLLAFEIFDRLNQRGVLCNLLTGEEYIPIPGATITAATIEMFSPHASGDVVIVDEAQMLSDPDRGWAWTRAMMEAQAPEIHVIGPVTIRNLVEQMATSGEIPLEIVEHERLAPIKVAESPWVLEKLPNRTILVAFSRRMVLELKTKLERAKRKVSVVYGSLPPEVRRKQAERFAHGETEICIATDAVGMGLNLPADYVCFYEIEKYDGRANRRLMPSEVQQIGGRAGRFGISSAGEIGATNRHNLEVIRTQYYTLSEDLTHARVAPTVDDLEMIPGSLADRLKEWGQLQSIPMVLRNLVSTADLSERIELAARLTDDEVEKLGLEKAVRLINAPARKSSRDYWYACAQAILHDKQMPLPPEPVSIVRDSEELDFIENCISCADIYLWLSQRKEFEPYGTAALYVRDERMSWSIRIDEALLRRLNMTRRCRECRKELAVGYPYHICESCYSTRFRNMEY